jgi:hypothetical protein
MMTGDRDIRREAPYPWPTHDPARERPHQEWGAEGATTPETLRQKDRAGDELLESGAI